MIPLIFMSRPGSLGCWVLLLLLLLLVVVVVVVVDGEEEEEEVLVVVLVVVLVLIPSFLCNGCAGMRKESGNLGSRTPLAIPRYLRRPLSLAG